ncbi:DUF11 domain-containing protein [Actinomadura rugatobispora]|uniref:DUF11 domain-containing protein n=1 Tax=Actinomadura rugatobispora TaxID=1994 RepID=A0ABW0ZWX7_9ACTN|nr:hypothetical protein GCM10010200_091680 [Actinomadura rugatobispora]
MTPHDADPAVVAALLPSLPAGEPIGGPAPQSPAPQDVPTQVALVNGSFEEPRVTSGIENRVPDASQPGARSVPGWQTTASDRLIEIWHRRSGTEAAHGEQFAELNANESSTLYQDLETTPGTTLYWSLRHRGRSGDDTMSLKIGRPGSRPNKTWTFTDGTAAWGRHTGAYTVPRGQTVTRFAFEAGATATGDPTVGNFLDDVVFGTAPCVVVTATAEPLTGAGVGDTITCTVNLKNHGGVPAENLILREAVPPGTSFVPGSLKVTGGPGDGAAGRYDPESHLLTLPVGLDATADLGGALPSTVDLPDGVTVEFQIRVERDGAGGTPAHQATATYDNTAGEAVEQLTSISDTAAVETAAVEPLVETPDEAADLPDALPEEGGAETPAPAVCTTDPEGVCVADQLKSGGAFRLVLVPAGQDHPGQATCVAALTSADAPWPGCSREGREDRWAQPGAHLAGPPDISLSFLPSGKKRKKRKHHKRLIRELTWQVSELSRQLTELTEQP